MSHILAHLATQALGPSAPTAALPMPQAHERARDSQTCRAFADRCVCGQAVPAPGKLPHCPSTHSPCSSVPLRKLARSPLAHSPLQPCPPSAPTWTSPCLRACLGAAQGQRQAPSAFVPPAPAPGAWSGGLSKRLHTERLGHLAPQHRLCISYPLVPQTRHEHTRHSTHTTRTPHATSWCAGGPPPLK